jgi:endonuclease III
MARPRTPKGRATAVRARLVELYPEAICELDHETPFQLLVATILSAQCTDKKVNEVTPALFVRYPAPADLAAANSEELEELIRPTGFYRAKANSLKNMAARLVDTFDSTVPGGLDDLTSLAGVGRKTANVVRSVALGLPGLPVDTHVIRLMHRLGITTEDDAVKIELFLNGLIPADERGGFSLRTILHGRRVCGAKKPQCAECSLADLCPSAGTF